MSVAINNVKPCFQLNNAEDVSAETPIFCESASPSPHRSNSADRLFRIPTEQSNDIELSSTASMVHQMTLIHQLTSPSAKYPGFVGLMISRFTYNNYYLLLFSFTSGSLLSNPQLMIFLKFFIYLASSKQQVLNLTL